MSELKAAAEAARQEALGLLEKGEFAPALAAYDRALEAANATNDPAFVDWMFVCRAAAAAEVGPADKELVELKRILLRTRDEQTAFRAAYSTAWVYEQKKDRAKAMFYARLAQRHAAAIGDVHLVSSCENQLGDILAADSRFEEAAASYRRCLDLSTATEGLTPKPFSPTWRAICQDNLGYCLLSLDRVPEGLALVHDALDTLEREDARGFTVYPLMDLCFGYLKSNRLAEARWFGEEGLARVAAASDLPAEKNLLYLLGESCHLAGDTPAAQGYFDRLATLYPEFKNLRAYLEVFDFRNVINLRS
jgi:tetratricopeptide (TPR) repeat protein